MVLRGDGWRGHDMASAERPPDGELEYLDDECGILGSTIASERLFDDVDLSV